MIPEWKQRAYLERLQKRADHLEKRTTGNRNLTYDVAELNALKWAIRTLRDLYNL
jgi:hypothetical protein